MTIACICCIWDRCAAEVRAALTEDDDEDEDDEREDEDEDEDDELEDEDEEKDDDLEDEDEDEDDELESTGGGSGSATASATCSNGGIGSSSCSPAKYTSRNAICAHSGYYIRQKSEHRGGKVPLTHGMHTQFQTGCLMEHLIVLSA